MSILLHVDERIAAVALLHEEGSSLQAFLEGCVRDYLARSPRTMEILRKLRVSRGPYRDTMEKSGVRPLTDVERLQMLDELERERLDPDVIPASGEEREVGEGEGEPQA